MEYAHSVGEVRCIWIAREEDEVKLVRSLGYEAYLGTSLKGIYFAFRGGYHFICNGLGDVNRTLALTSRVVNFWHGTPIKKVYLDAEVEAERFGKNRLAGWLARTAMKLMNRSIFRLYSSNSLEGQVVSRAAGIPPERVRVHGSPRFDYIRRLLQERDALLTGLRCKGVVLYAPTWREDGKWEESFRIDENSARRLISFLESEDFLFVVKPHPLTTKDEVDSWQLLEHPRVVLASSIGMTDINRIYAISDVIITDVSSAIFDYLVVSDKIIFFMPDYEKYVSGSRGVYEHYWEIVSNSLNLTWSGVIDRLMSGDSASAGLDIISELRSEVTSLSDTCRNIYSDIRRAS